MANFFLLLLYQSYLWLLNLPFLADEYEMLRDNLSAPAKIDNVFNSLVWPLSFFLPSIILFFFYTNNELAYKYRISRRYEPNFNLRYKSPHCTQHSYYSQWCVGWPTVCCNQYFHTNPQLDLLDLHTSIHQQPTEKTDYKHFQIASLDCCSNLGLF